MKKVFVAIPALHDALAAQPYFLRRLEKKYGDSVKLVYPEFQTMKMFHDAARNSLVEEFLASDCDILWFLDSDILPPENILDLVKYHSDDWQCAGAPYPVFMTPGGEEHKQVVFCVYKKGPSGGMHPCGVPNSGTDFVDGIATGCLFIKREVFSKLSKPYFEFTYDKEDRGIKCGEDINFCLRASELGIKFFIDFSLVCRHYKTVDLLEINDYAVMYAQKAVLAYDQSIRGKVESLQKRLEGKMSPTPQTKSQLILPKGLVAPR